MRFLINICLPSINQLVSQGADGTNIRLPKIATRVKVPDHRCLRKSVYISNFPNFGGIFFDRIRGRDSILRTTLKILRRVIGRVARRDG